MTREEWLKERRNGIGASEAAAVLGLSPYASPLSVFYEKTSGEAIQEDSELLEWGQLLEGPISAKYEQVTKRRVVAPEQFTIYRDVDAPYLFCTPDRLTYPRSNSVEFIPLQLKNTAYFNPNEELVVHWQIQEQHECMVLGSSGASFGILVAGRKFYYADIDRNQNFIDYMRERLEEFWDHVQRGIPPETDGHDATTEALKRMYPQERGTVIDLPEECAEYALRLEWIEEQMAELASREKIIKNKLRSLIADNTFGQLPDGSGFSLKTTKRDGYSVEPTTYRQLRRVKSIPKGLLKS